MKSAVLVIDVQQGLCAGPNAAFDCDGTIRRINAVTRKARDAEVPVFFIHAFRTAGHDAWQCDSGFLKKRNPLSC